MSKEKSVSYFSRVYLENVGQKNFKVEDLKKYFEQQEIKPKEFQYLQISERIENGIRSTFKVPTKTYDKLESLKDVSGISKQEIVSSIAEDITTGKYDYLIPESERTRSVSVYQKDTKKVKEYLKDKNINFQELLIEIIEEM